MKGLDGFMKEVMKKDEILCDEEIQCGEEKKAADCDLKIKRSSYFIKCTFKTTTKFF